MKNFSFSLAGLLIASISLSFINPEKKTAENVSPALNAVAEVHSTNYEAEAIKLSNEISENPEIHESGISQETLKLAIKGYLHLKETNQLKNPDVLSIVDLSQSSRKKRFYLIDLKNHVLLVNTFVAHGKNSGIDMATNFSNTIGSEKSSLGFYITKETYQGKHGYSLKLDGLEKGFNDNAEKRAIVMHAADYVNAGRVQSPYMGRSQGCPALPNDQCKKTISLIKDGSVLFVYSPQKNYLQNSTLLNS